MEKLPKTKKKIVTSFRIEPKLKRDLKSLAKIRKIKTGGMICQICEEYVLRMKKSYGFDKKEA